MCVFWYCDMGSVDDWFDMYDGFLFLNFEIWFVGELVNVWFVLFLVECCVWFYCLWFIEVWKEEEVGEVLWICWMFLINYCVGYVFVCLVIFIIFCWMWLIIEIVWCCCMYMIDVMCVLFCFVVVELLEYCMWLIGIMLCVLYVDCFLLFVECLCVYWYWFVLMYDVVCDM